jgi:aspartyl-tRNA(Asn)/glutamyl-tRNA(Gln) amidotransferase subunit C
LDIVYKLEITNYKFAMFMSKKITLQEVKKTAELARINLTSQEEKQITENLSKILDFFVDIEKIKSDKIEKFDHYQLRENNLRVDQILERDDESRMGIKENFPETEGDYLKVKTVIKK